MARSLEESVARWEAIAKTAATYNLTLDDWLNDLDLRDVIERQRRHGEITDALQSRLEAADHEFRENTRETTRSLWGDNAGADHRPTREWWYFRYPSSPGKEMRTDLQAAGVLPSR
jgi:hypothetical protein